MRGLEEINSETLIFFDEIQNSSKVISSLRYFHRETDYYIIGSGSMMGINRFQTDFFPAGDLSFLEMRSLDFEEFLWAKNIPEKAIIELLTHYKNKSSVPDFLHASFSDLLKEYILIGGMPEVLVRYLNNNLVSAFNLQIDLVRAYQNDIIKDKYNPDAITALECFNSIPGQLSKVNKKFQYSYVKKGSNSKKYDSAINYLVDTGIVIKCNNLNSLNIPLITQSKNDCFKLYLHDIGLFVSMLGIEARDAISNNDYMTFNGAIIESLIATSLNNRYLKLYYYSPHSELELDFISLYKGKLVVIEVKSSDNTKSKSLTTILENNKIKYAVKYSKKNIGYKEIELKGNKTSVYIYPQYLSFLNFDFEE
jgi:predicted AAA+ superfamily ATPase